MQLHYTEWPDHGIPDDPQPFIGKMTSSVCLFPITFPTGFVNELRSLRKRFDPSSPVVVHCSAGVGRSGVAALTEMLIDKVDIGEVMLQSIYKRLNFFSCCSSSIYLIV